MKVFVDLQKQMIIKTDDEGRQLFKGDINADVIKVYFDQVPDAWFFSLSGMPSNGRPIKPKPHDGIVHTETIDDKLWYYYTFTLSKQNGFNVSVGLLSLYLHINYVNANNQVTLEKTLGDIKVYVLKGNEFEDNIIILGEEIGEVVFNMKTELEQLNARIANDNAHKAVNILEVLGGVLGNLLPTEAEGGDIGSTTNYWRGVYALAYYVLNNGKAIQALSPSDDGGVMFGNIVTTKDNEVTINAYNSRYTIKFGYVVEPESSEEDILETHLALVKEGEKMPVFYLLDDGTVYADKSLLNEILSNSVTSTNVHASNVIANDIDTSYLTSNNANIDKATIQEQTSTKINTNSVTSVISNTMIVNANILRSQSEDSPLAVNGNVSFNGGEGSVTYKNSEVGTHSDLALKYNVTAHEAFAKLMEAKHNEIDELHKIITDRLQAQIDIINGILKSDNVDLDSLQEVADALEASTALINKKANTTYVDEQISLQQAYTNTKVAEAVSNFNDTMERHRVDTDEQLATYEANVRAFVEQTVGTLPITLATMVEVD